MFQQISRFFLSIFRNLDPACFGTSSNLALGRPTIIYVTDFCSFFGSQGKNWDFSLAFIWNTIVWFMLINFFVKIVNATARRHLMKQQDKEIAALNSKKSDDSNT